MGENRVPWRNTFLILPLRTHMKGPATVTLNLAEVDFGGKKVWPDGPGSIIVNRKTVTLTPTNIQEDLTVTITVNDELANYYFGKPVYRTCIVKFAGHSYLIGVKLTLGLTAVIQALRGLWLSFISMVSLGIRSRLTLALPVLQ